jgi:1-acyl-sn-glycerol-3-phosphate acyltransferase
MLSEPDFYPPKLNPKLVRLTQTIAPWLARWWYWLCLEIDPADLQRLLQFRDRRLLLLPNHPTFHDPIVMFLLSAQLKRACYYMAAYETLHDPSMMFLISSGFRPLSALARREPFKRGLRWLLQHLGMYSVRRGLPDRASMNQTWKLLGQPDCCLVIFPEGGCSFQNDTVMPFRVGALQIAFHSLQQSLKRGENPSDLYVAPLAIKYRYTQNMQGTIHATLKGLERRLALSSQPGMSDYERLRAIAQAVLVRLERDYGIQDVVPTSSDWNARIARLKKLAIETCEQQLGISSPARSLMRERVYLVQHCLQTQAEDLEQSPMWTTEAMDKAMRRLLNFDAIYDGYVAADPTPERFLDTLIRLEREAFDIDRPSPKGFRRVRVRVGEIVNLKDFLADYRGDRSAVVTQLTATLQQSVQAHLADV